MASNKPTGDNVRKGAVRKRRQSENPTTELETKRNKTSGEFMDTKSTRRNSKVPVKKNN